MLVGSALITVLPCGHAVPGVLVGYGAVAITDNASVIRRSARNGLIQGYAMRKWGRVETYNTADVAVA